MVPVMRQMRAYFAPVNRTTEAPTIFDPAAKRSVRARFPSQPVAGSGLDRKFRALLRHADRTGAVGSRTPWPVAQFRGPLEARVEFDFREWGKLQMALAGGSEHMNVLATSPSAAPAPSGGTPIAGVAVLRRLDGERTCFWRWRSKWIRRGKSGRCGCGLPATDWDTWDRGFRRRT